MIEARPAKLQKNTHAAIVAPINGYKMAEMKLFERRRGNIGSLS